MKTCLVNLGMWGNLTAIMEILGIGQKLENCEWKLVYCWLCVSDCCRPLFIRVVEIIHKRCLRREGGRVESNLDKTDEGWVMVCGHCIRSWTASFWLCYCGTGTFDIAVLMSPSSIISALTDLLAGRCIQSVSWSLTSPFSTIWLYQRQKFKGGELSLPSEGRPAIY